MFFFIFILTLGLVFAWAKGYLNWEKSSPIVPKTKFKVPETLYDKINQKWA